MEVLSHSVTFLQIGLTFVVLLTLLVADGTA